MEVFFEVSASVYKYMFSRSKQRTTMLAASYVENFAMLNILCWKI